LPEWLGEILRWFVRPKTVTHCKGLIILVFLFADLAASLLLSLISSCPVEVQPIAGCRRALKFYLLVTELVTSQEVFQLKVQFEIQ